MKNYRLLSPIGLLGLAACANQSNDDSSPFISSGFAIKGPLANALVFADANNNGLFDEGETSVRTGSDGSYTLSNPNQFTVVVIADDNTTNALTGAKTGTFTMSGAADAGVITPFSSLQQADLDDAKVAKLAEQLGLDPEFDFINDNPFADDSGLTDAQKLAFEKAGSQMMSLLQVTAAAVQEAAGGEDQVSDLEAFNLAFDALASEVEESLDANETVDFANTNFVGEVVQTTVSDTKESGVTVGSLDTGNVATKIAVINEKIDTVEALDGSDTVAQILAGGRDVAEDIQDKGIDAVNLAPLDLKLRNNFDPDYEVPFTYPIAGHIFGQIVVEDDDATETYLYEIVGGADADSLVIDPNTGVLSFKPDYELAYDDDLLIEVEIKVTEVENPDLSRTESFSVSLFQENLATGRWLSGDPNFDDGVPIGGFFYAITGAGYQEGHFQSHSVLLLVDGVKTEEHVVPLAETFLDATQEQEVPILLPGSKNLAGKKVSFIEKVVDNVGTVSYGEEVVVGTFFVPNASPDVVLDESTLGVDEGDDEGTVVAQGTLSDDDGDALAASLTGPDAALFDLVVEGGAFQVKLAAGTVIDFETAQTHSVTLVVSDGEASTETPITVNVTNVQEGKGTFDVSVPTAPVDGERNVGDAVEASTTGSDPDGIVTMRYDWYVGDVLVQSGSQSSYTPTADDVGKTFYLDWYATDALGEVTEAVNYIQLGTVVPGANKAPTIEVTPAKDGATTPEIDENVAPGTLVATVALTDDRDAVPGNSVQLNIGGADIAQFDVIDMGNGTYQIVTAAGFTPDFETRSTYAITLIASDGDKSTEEEMSIGIANLQEGPGDFAVSVVDEGADTDRKVGDTIEATTSGTDPDGIEDVRFDWYVAAEEGDGVTKVGTGATFTPTADLVGKQIYLDWYKTDKLGAEDTTPNYVSIGIVVPENRAPQVEVFPVVAGASNPVIDENEVGGTVVAELNATDADGDPVSLELKGPDAAQFELVNQGSADYPDYVVKTVAGFSPDFEDVSSYALEIHANDGTDTTTHAFTVDVKNLQEGAGDLGAEVAAPPVDGERNVGDEIEVVTTGTDPDGIAASNFIWYVGDVEVQNGATPTYTPTSDDVGKPIAVVWQYHDGFKGPEGSPTSAGRIELGTVMPGPNAAPDIDVTPAKDGATTPVVDENAAPGTVVATVKLTDDRDAVPGNAVTYGLGGADADKFEAVDLGNGSFQIKTAAGFTPDFEDKSSFTLEITASDGDKSSSQPVTVNVANLQEGAGDFNVTVDEPGVPGERFLGQSIVATPTGSDPDGTTGVTYIWHVDGIVVQQGPSNEYLPNAGDVFGEVSLTWTATDGAGGVNSSSGHILVGTVMPGPNAAPEIKVEPVVDGAATPVIDENAAEGTVVAKVTLTDDRDQLPDNTVQLSLGGTDAALFEAVDLGGGVFNIRTAPGVSPDFETKSSYTLEITASDGDKSYTTPVTIDVANLQEGPATLDYTIEGNDAGGVQYVGDAVTIKPADVDPFIDPDGVESVTYIWRLDGQIVMSGTETVFHPGGPTVGEKLTVEIVVTDLLGATTSSGVIDLGTITWPANKAPVIAFTPYHGTATNVDIDENAPAGKNLGYVDLTDDRDDADENPLSLSLSGADAGDFRIVDDGNNRFTIAFENGVSPDFETKPSYDLQIVATDQEGASSTHDLVVSINNVQEGPTSGDLNASSGTVVVGQPVSLSPVLADPDGVASTTYIWKVDGVVDPAATGSSYTPSDDQVGRTISVTVAATDALGAVTNFDLDFGAVDKVYADPVVVFSFLPGHEYPIVNGRLQMNEELPEGTPLGKITITNLDDAFDGADPVINLSGSATPSIVLVDMGGGVFELRVGPTGTPDAETAPFPEGDIQIEVIGPEGQKATLSLLGDLVNIDDNPADFTLEIIGEPVLGETLELIIDGEDRDNDAFGGTAPLITIAWFADGQEIPGQDGRFLEITEELAGAMIEAVVDTQDASGAITQFSTSVKETISADIIINAPLAELAGLFETLQNNVQMLAEGQGSYFETIDSALQVWDVIRYNLPEDFKIGPDGISFTLDAIEGNPFLIEMGFDETHNFQDAMALFAAEVKQHGLKAFFDWDNWAAFGKMGFVNVSGKDVHGQQGDLLTVEYNEGGSPDGKDTLGVTVGVHDVSDRVTAEIAGDITVGYNTLVGLGKEVVNTVMAPLPPEPHWPDEYHFGSGQDVYDSNGNWVDWVWVWNYPGAEDDYNAAVDQYYVDLQAYQQAIQLRDDKLLDLVTQNAGVFDVTWVGVGFENEGTPVAELDLDATARDAVTGELLDAIELNVAGVTATLLGDLPRGADEWAQVVLDDVPAFWSVGENLFYDLSYGHFSPWSFWPLSGVQSFGGNGYDITQFTLDGLTGSTPDAADIVVNFDGAQDALWQTIYGASFLQNVLMYGYIPASEPTHVSVFEPEAASDALAEVYAMGGKAIGATNALFKVLALDIGTNLVGEVPGVLADLSGRSSILSYDGAGSAVVRVTLDGSNWVDFGFENFSGDDPAALEAAALDLLMDIADLDEAPLSADVAALSGFGDVTFVELGWKGSTTRIQLDRDVFSQRGEMQDTITLTHTTEDGEALTESGIWGQFDTSVGNSASILSELLEAIIFATPQDFGAPPEPQRSDYAEEWEYQNALENYEDGHWTFSDAHLNGTSFLLAQGVEALENFDLNGMFLRDPGETKSFFVVDIADDIQLADGSIGDQYTLRFGDAKIRIQGEFPAGNTEFLGTFLDALHYGQGLNSNDVQNFEHGVFEGLFAWYLYDVEEAFHGQAEIDLIQVLYDDGTGEEVVFEASGNTDPFVRGFDLEWGYWFETYADYLIATTAPGEENEYLFSFWNEHLLTSDSVDLQALADTSLYAGWDFSLNGWEVEQAIEHLTGVTI